METKNEVPTITVTNDTIEGENIDDIKANLYQLPPEIKEQIQDNRLDYFYKENMYILTVDTPLVAFTLYCGINVLYITHDGKLVKFEAHPDNTFNL